MLYGSNGRGVHPRLRSNSFLAFPFDETSGDGIDLLGGFDLTGYGFGTVVPTIVASDVGGKARRFSAAANSVLTASASISSLVSEIQTDQWTLQARLRMLSSGTTGTILHIGGDEAIETAIENIQFRLSYDSNNNLVILTENGAGVDQTHTFTAFTFVKNVPFTLAIRARDGAASGVRYDLFVNGHLVETSPDLTPPDSGANSVLMLGSGYSSAAPAFFGDFDDANLFFYGEPLDIEQIEEDARRLHLLPLHSKVQTKVEIEDQSAGTANLSDLQGLDWVDSFSISDSSDDPLRTATIELLREQENLSLAYLKTDTRLNLTDVTDPTSYDPLVDVMRDVECFAARLPLFIDADSADWISVFDGIIDAVDWSGEKVTLNCRDNGARLVDTYIETENDFGVGATATLEQVIQNILDDNDSSSVSGSYPPVTLFAPLPSQWILEIQNADGLQLKQRREPVASAVRNLAGQIGWEVRYQYDPDPISGGWKFSLYEPDRLRGDVDILLGPDDVESITQLKISAQRTRSDIRIVYPSTETTTPGAITLPAGISEIDRGWIGVDGSGNPTFAYLHVANTTTRTRYGRRFFEIAEAATSQINTIDEAARMASAIALDLGEPEALYDATMPNLFELQASDMLKMLQNRILHTGAQRLSSLVISHEFGPSPRTTARMRGKPSVGFKRWMALGTYPGQSRPPTINPFNTLTDQTIGQLVPYVSALLTRTDYFANSAKFAGLKNPNFVASTSGSENKPDGWEHFTDAAAGLNWGTGNYAEYEYSIARSGNQSVKFNVANTLPPINQLRSDFFAAPFGDGSTVAIEWSEARETDGTLGGAAQSNVEIFAFFFDKDKNLLSSAGPFSYSTVGVAQHVFVNRAQQGISAPANTRWMKVYVTAAFVDTAHYIDRVSVTTQSTEALVSNSTTQTGTSPTNPVVNNTWTTLNLDTASKDYGSNWDNVNMEWTCPQDGSFDLLSGVRAIASGLATVIDIANVKLQIDTGGGFGDLIVGQGGTFDDGVTNAPIVSAQVALNQYALTKGDKIRAQGILSYSGGAPTSFGFSNGPARTFLSIKLRQTE